MLYPPPTPRTHTHTLVIGMDCTWGGYWAYGGKNFTLVRTFTCIGRCIDFIYYRPGSFKSYFWEGLFQIQNIQINFSPIFILWEAKEADIAPVSSIIIAVNGRTMLPCAARPPLQLLHCWQTSPLSPLDGATLRVVTRESRASAVSLLLTLSGLLLERLWFDDTVNF